MSQMNCRSRPLEILSISFLRVPVVRYTRYGKSVGTYRLVVPRQGDSVHLNRVKRYHAPGCLDHMRHSKLLEAPGIVKPAMLLDDNQLVVDRPARDQYARVDSRAGPIVSLRCLLWS